MIRIRVGLVQVGLSLMLLQLLLVWHLGPVFHSSELPWQILALGALLGQGAGYWLSDRGWSRGLLLLAALAPGLAVGLRWVSASGILLHHPWLRLLAGLGIGLVCSAGLAQLTIAYWKHRPPGVRLAQFYGLELAGAIGCLGLVLAVGPDMATLLYPWAVAAAAQGRVGGLGLGLLVVTAGLQTLTFGTARRAAAATFYAPQVVVAQAVSPYQYVEVVSSENEPYLYLNGLCHYGPSATNQLNHYLALWPAQRLGPQARAAGCVVLGAGSFVAPALTLQEGLDTTVIELDPEVVRLGKECFREQWSSIDDLKRLTTVVGDARQQLTRQSATGLIVVNLPTPYSLNVASLFTQEFFELARGNLVSGGQLSLFLGSPLRERLDTYEGAVIAALLQVFPHVMAISSKTCDNTVVLASEAPLGSAAEWRRHLRSQGQVRFRILETDELRALAASHGPASRRDFRFCAALNYEFWFGR